MKKFLAFLVSLVIIVSPCYGSQTYTIDEFKGLQRDPTADKIDNGGHTVFDNAWISGKNIQVIKGRDRLNSTAHTDTVVNGIAYYENAAGSTKKIVVAESDEVVTYATDGTGRSSIASSLTNEPHTFTQIGDTLYFTSSTDGLYKWSGSGSASAITGVSAPSAVDFSASSTVGGMTPGLDAVVNDKTHTSNNIYSWSGSSCIKVGAIYNYGSLDSYDADNVDCDQTTHYCQGTLSAYCFDSTHFTKTCATSSDYKYKITKYNSKWGIESEPSSSDSVSLKGSNTVSSATIKSLEGYYSDSSCANPASYSTERAYVFTGALTSTTGTVASDPGNPFDSYRVYRTVAGGSDYFLLGDTKDFSGTYADGKPDTALSTPLDTTIDTITPPSYKYIEEYKGVIFLAEGNTVQFNRIPVGSVTDADTYWLATDLLTTGAKKPITGLHKTQNSLLIFTENSVLELTGFGVDSFRLRTLIEGVGAVSGTSIVTDSNGDVIFFSGTKGVYKIRVSEQRADELTGTLIDQQDSKVVRISTPPLEPVFGGTDSSIVLSLSEYSSSNAYFDTDTNIYWLFIGTDAFLYDTSSQQWSHVPGIKSVASVFRKSPNASNQGVYIDNLGYMWNNWTGFEGGAGTGTVTGNPTSSASTTLTDSTATFNTTNDGLKGVFVVVDTAGTLQYRQITGNTGTQLTVTPAWTVNPATTSTYYVGYIAFDLKTKQYNLSKPPKVTIIQTISLVHEKSASTQYATLRTYTNKSTTAQADTFTIDLSQNYIDKQESSISGNWVQWGLQSFVYQTSNTIVPPVNIINYSFRAYEQEE